MVDVENGLKVYYMEDNIVASYSKNNNLYVAEAALDVLEYYPSTSAYRDVEYMTGEFTNGDITKKKQYRSLKINALGTYSIDVFVNGVKVCTQTQESDFLPTDTYGNYISFRIISSGDITVKGITYEYVELKD